MGLITLTRIFAALVTAPPSYLDDNFNAIVNMINGNLDETNVKMAADTKLAGTYGISATPAANKIPVLGADSRFPFNSMSMRGALVKKSAGQSITNNVETLLTFDQEVYDTDTIHDNVTNNSRLVVPTGVSYAKLIAQIAWATHVDSNVRQFILYKNGAVVDGGITSITKPTASGANTTAAASAVLAVTPNDYFEIKVLQTSGVALNVVSGTAQTWFAMEVIG